MPTLVFDIRANHDTGVSRYGLSLLAEAAPLVVDAGWRMVVTVRAIQEDRARAAVSGLDVELLVCPEEEGFVRGSAWLRDLLRERRADLYYTSHYTVDRECPVPFVFTIHDLTRLRFPELSYTDASFVERFGPAELKLVRAELGALAEWDEPHPGEAAFTRYFRALNRCLADRAAGIAVVSHATAGDVRSLLNADPDRLALVPCGVDTTVFRHQDQTNVRAAREVFGLAGPYLVFVGLAHPNKRFPWLIEQLARERHRLPRPARVVAVGGHAEQVPEVSATLARYDANDLVIFTGRISDAELAALYGGASALVTASLNEGNNLPPLEAMACGSQVIATDIPPLRETLGGSAHFYDPADGDALVELAGQALGGTLPDHARSFRPPTWADTATAMMKLLHRVTAGQTAVSS